MQTTYERIAQFVQPYYTTKDIMHDFSHIQRVQFSLNALVAESSLTFDTEIAQLALLFHGIIYSHEPNIRTLLADLGFTSTKIDHIVRVAWESQKEGKPSTNEGLLLHDAHMLEGGRNFEIIKSLITGSVRGQTLDETLQYIEEHLLSKGRCYTPAGILKYANMQARTRELYQELCNGIGRNISLK